MASDSTTHLELPYLAAAQAQKHVTHNEALRRLDAIVQLAVLTRALASPPAAPVEGDRHIVAGGATGDWTGRSGYVAAWIDGAWTFFDPQPGWIAWVEAESRLLVYVDDTGGWTDFAGALFAGNLAKLGINTTADASNRLAVKADAVLMSHDDVTPGSGHLHLTLNKSAASRDAGFVFQDGWSSRALVGLLGSDDFVIKVSPDGTAFIPALSVSRTSGRLTLAADLPLSEGGTGASTRARARYNLGLRANLPKQRKVTDGTWLASTTPADNNWFAICWAAELGLYCAIAQTGSGNCVMTSPDGVNWTARTSAADNSWAGLCWAPELGLFVAVGGSGTGNRVMTSPDGVNWTARASAADNSWRSICWAPELGLLVAVAITGSGNRVMTSPDGITWTSQASAANYSWSCVCWSAELGLFVAVAGDVHSNPVMTSPDGVTWTTRIATSNTWYGVCWSAELGLFAAVATSGTGNRVMTSPDGITWTTRASAADNGWVGICWAAEIGLFVAVANSGVGNRIMTSSDGLTWTLRASAADNGWRAVCWAPELGLLAAVANSGTGNRAMTSVSAHTLSYRSA